MASVDPYAMGRRFTILIVEDDRDVRDGVVQMLSAGSYKVLAAGDGYEAIRLLVTHPVDVMLTDIVMPGLSGYELAAQARLIRPLLRILYATGFDGKASGRDIAWGYGALLTKPIRAQDLIREIEQVLPV